MHWLIGCTHFGHAKIIEYTKRPFQDATEMNEALTRNWNKCVDGAQDTVFVLGDFAFGLKEEVGRQLHRLNGLRVILIRGNHDRGPVAMEEVGFCAVFEEVVVKWQGLRILLSHKPRDVLPPNVDGIFHAHVHRGDPADLYEAGETPYLQPFNVNLSAEAINYTPVSAKTAIKMLRGQLKGAKR